MWPQLTMQCSYGIFHISIRFLHFKDSCFKCLLRKEGYGRCPAKKHRPYTRKPPDMDIHKAKQFLKRHAIRGEEHPTAWALPGSWVWWIDKHTLLVLCEDVGAAIFAGAKQWLAEVAPNAEWNKEDGKGLHAFRPQVEDVFPDIFHYPTLFKQDGYNYQVIGIGRDIEHRRRAACLGFAALRSEEESDLQRPRVVHEVRRSTWLPKHRIERFYDLGTFWFWLNMENWREGNSCPTARCQVAGIVQKRNADIFEDVLECCGQATVQLRMRLVDAADGVSPRREAWHRATSTRTTQSKRHLDKNNRGLSLIFTLQKHTGGELFVEYEGSERIHVVKDNLVKLDGSQHWHGAKEFQGIRFAVVLYSMGTSYEDTPALGRELSRRKWATSYLKLPSRPTSHRSLNDSRNKRREERRFQTSVSTSHPKVREKLMQRAVHQAVLPRDLRYLASSCFFFSSATCSGKISNHNAFTSFTGRSS